MATVGQLIVMIGANVKKFVSGMQEAANTAKDTADNISGEMNSLAQNTQQATTKTGRYLTAAVQQARQMREAIKQAEKAVRQDFAALSESASQFAGKNREFMGSLEQLGLKQKKITDQLIASNEAMKTSFFQSTAAIMARTNSAVKTMEHIERVGNPIRVLDPMFLGVANRLETMAKNGQAAVVALRELGPTANMKELSDLVRLINQRLMGIQMLQLGAGIITAVELYLIVKLANAVDQTLVPAFERFKAVWLEALRPFGEMMANVIKSILGVMTAVGEFFVALNQINPVITQMIFGFFALIAPLTLILAPLAIGISAVNAYAAAFGGLWMMIGPVVTAFLAVIGTVIVVSAAIVAAIAIWNQMWQASENLRNVVSWAWDNIKTAVLSALAPLAPAWENLKVAFLNMIATFVGAEPNASSIWKAMGDSVAKFVTWFSANAVPAIKAALDVLVKVITTAMNLATKVLNAVAKAWNSDFLFIRTIVTDTWNNIKEIFQSGTAIIKNIFEGFSNLFKGNWKGLWENVKTIFSEAIDLIWAWIQVWGVGKILKFIGTIAGKYKSAFGELWSGVKNVFDDYLGRLHSTVSSKFDGIVSFIQGLRNTFYNAGRGLIMQMKDGIENAFSSVLSTVKSLAGKVRDYLPFSPAKVGPLSDLDKLDFAGPIRDSILKGIPRVEASMNHLFAAPTVQPVYSVGESYSNTGSGSNSDVSQIINFERIFEGANISVRSDNDVKAIARELYQLFQSKSRGTGVRR
ncbi:hypothetical protein [Ammoniphilus sp. YIM 78166]|uniref:phage tail protein n=1 Tax=Ammoniphilus sp. YIM 78166 TaxID=1644106 RepID=UPI001070362A|nr:hypothetical protein [Ammoniphilus sp. YIM 78166]